MIAIELLLSILATWRISSLLVREDGPLDVFAKLRTISGITYNEYSQPQASNFISSLLLCVWCTSIWVAVSIAILEKPANILVFIRRALALSAGAIIVDEMLNKEGDNGN